MVKKGEKKTEPDCDFLTLSQSVEGRKILASVYDKKDPSNDSLLKRAAIFRLQRSRGFCYTINNYDWQMIIEACCMYEDYKVSYQVIGFEVGEEGTHHLQCYIYHKDPITKGVFEDRLQETFGFNPHSECQTAKKNINAYGYCMKDSNFIEQGTRPIQGKRSDLEIIKCDLLNGGSQTKISKQYPSQWFQYRRAFTEFQQIHGLNYRDTQLVYYQNTAESIHQLKQFHRMHSKKKISYHEYASSLMEEVSKGVYDFVICQETFITDSLSEFARPITDYLPGDEYDSELNF